jgi:hypothetical protein
MYCSFYLRKGVAFVPTMARTEAGYWLGVEPVQVQAVSTVDELQKLLLAAVSRGNPTVKTPTRQNFPRDVMERYCGLKSVSAFERTATCWSISNDGSEYRICEWVRSSRYRGAREEARDREIRLPIDVPLEEAVRRAAETAMSEHKNA